MDDHSRHCVAELEVWEGHGRGSDAMAIERLVKARGGEMTTRFRVPDATCGHCKQTIEGTVSAIEGVQKAELDLDTKTLSVEHEDVVDGAALIGAISAAGYSPEATV